MQDHPPICLDFENAIDQIWSVNFHAVAQSHLDADPLLFSVQASLPKCDDPRMQLCDCGQTHEIADIQRDHHLIAIESVRENGFIVGASKADMHSGFSWNSLLTGPADDARTEVFIDQQLQGEDLQPRCSVSDFRGRP